MRVQPGCGQGWSFVSSLFDSSLAYRRVEVLDSLRLGDVGVAGAQWNDSIQSV
jgi:hypothetical protein